MRKYEHAEIPGPPVVVVSEECDDDGCDRRYVLPQGDLATLVDGEWRTPPMPRATDMDALLKQDGWRQDYLLGKWSCIGGPIRALLPDSEAWEVEREEALRTQEFAIPDLPAEVEADDPTETVPDAVEALAGEEQKENAA